MIVYANRPALAANAFVLLLTFTVCAKDFMIIGKGGSAGLLQDNHKGVAEWCVPAGLCILLFIPNIQGVVARNFIGEQFHHNDSFIMAPGWAYLSGQSLDVDVISQYGIGFVVVISRLAQLLGGFSYEHVMAIMVYGTLVYYLTWYFLVRRLFGSTVLTAAVMLLGIKWQMFHSGAFPFVFTYGSMTPMRFVYDVIYFWCLWMHINTGHKTWLLGAAAACGFGIYYITSEGLYGSASFAAYILLLLAMPAWRKHFRICLRDGLLILLPLLIALFLLALTIGNHITTALFWNNIGEFISYFTSGFGLAPMYTTLTEHKYLESLMGFVMPMGYLLSLLIFLSRLAVNIPEKIEWFIVVLCFYGLGTFHYYVARSTGTSYDAVSLPFVFVLGYWVKIIIGSLKENQRTPARMALLVLAAWALVTTHLFISYPNLINLSSHPLTNPQVAGPCPTASLILIICSGILSRNLSCRSILWEAHKKNYWRKVILKMMPR